MTSIEAITLNAAFGVGQVFTTFESVTNNSTLGTYDYTIEGSAVWPQVALLTSFPDAELPPLLLLCCMRHPMLERSRWSRWCHLSWD